MKRILDFFVIDGLNKSAESKSLGRRLIPSMHVECWLYDERLQTEQKVIVVTVMTKQLVSLVQTCRRSLLFICDRFPEDT